MIEADGDEVAAVEKFEPCNGEKFFGYRNRRRLGCGADLEVLVGAGLDPPVEKIRS